MLNQVDDKLNFIRQILGGKFFDSIFTQVMENAPDGIQLVDLTGKVLYSNKAVESLYGYTEAEYRGKDVNEMNVDPQFAAKTILPAIQKTGSWVGQLMVKHKSGKTFPIWLSASMVNNETGEPLVMVGVIRDITEQKKEEKAALESRRQLNEAQHLAKVGSWDWVVATDTVTWSDELCNINGRDPKLPAIPYAEQASCYTPESWSRLDRAVKNTLATGSPYELELEFIRVDGAHRHCFVRGEAIKGDDGKIIRLSGIVQDITERKKIEKEFLESESRYEALADAAPLCIKWFDGHGNLISINKHGREEHHLEGKSEEEIRNWNYWSCIETHIHEELKKKMQLALEGKPQDILLEHVPGTATGRWCFSNLVPVWNAGKVQYVLFISRDVTKEKEVGEKEQKDIAELTKFKEATIDRELKMVELKKALEEANNRIKELEQKHSV